MISRMLDVDEQLGRVQYHHWDPVENRAVIESVFRVDPIIEQNKAILNSRSDYRPWAKGDWHFAASTPLSIYFDHVKSGRIHDHVAMKRWLEDPENSIWRTMRGRL